GRDGGVAPGTYDPRRLSPPAPCSRAGDLGPAAADIATATTAAGGRAATSRNGAEHPARRDGELDVASAARAARRLETAPHRPVPICTAGRGNAGRRAAAGSGDRGDTRLLRDRGARGRGQPGPRRDAVRGGAGA